MSEHRENSVRLPVNLDGLQQRVLLEAELMHIDAQLRHFAPVRDRLVAHDQDPAAKYRQLESRNDHIGSELKKLRSAQRRPAANESLLLPRDRSLRSALITPANFEAAPFGHWFGFSGTVMMGRPHEGLNIIPDGITGSIRTNIARGDGFIWFGGDVIAAANPQPKEYFTLHSWTYLIPFPPPTVTSLFAYTLTVGVEAAIERASGPSNIPTVFWQFVSVGETPHFRPSQDVVVDTPVAWPLVTSLSPFQSNAYAVSGESTIQRSFLVQAGSVPAVALAIGVVLNVESGAEVVFGNGASFVFSQSGFPEAGTVFGAVDFLYHPFPIDGIA